MTGPNPQTAFPPEGYQRLCFLKNIINHPQIEVGDYTYYDDFENVDNFIRNVRYLFDFIGDRLIIGKFFHDSLRGRVYHEWRQPPD